MKKIEFVTLSAALLILFTGTSVADTFKNRQTGEILHGYIAAKPSQEQPQEILVTFSTIEKGIFKQNPNQWEITRDNAGRNNKVIMLPLDEPIMYEIETEAFEKAVVSASQEGPLFILIEIDTPGGRVDLAQRMCKVIIHDADCNVIAYVKGGQYGGAISAGAAVALSCNKIYMAENTIIGAATLVTMAKDKDENKDKKYVDVVNEKMSSAWRAFLASLAQQNDRPGLLARAMVDSSIEVIEVNENSKRLFIDPVNKKPGEQVSKTWNKSGSLLTLTANEAVDCTIADGLIASRDQLLAKYNARDSNVIVDKKIAASRKELQIAMRKLEMVVKDFDLKIKQSKYQQPAPKFLAILKGAKADFEILKTLSKKYPDLHLDTADIEAELNSINAAYENILRETKRRN